MKAVKRSRRKSTGAEKVVTSTADASALLEVPLDDKEKKKRSARPGETKDPQSSP